MTRKLWLRACLDIASLMVEAALLDVYEPPRRYFKCFAGEYFTP